MSKTKKQKAEIIDELRGKIDNSRAMVFINFSGINVSDIQAFRQKCKDANAEYLVAKKTLIKKALEAKGLNGIDPTKLASEIGVIFGYGDEVGAAKIVDEFRKNLKTMQFVSGILPHGTGAEYLDAMQVENLAKIPCRNELLAQVVGSIHAPLLGFVNVLMGNIRGLVTVLHAIQEKKHAN